MNVPSREDYLAQTRGNEPMPVFRDLRADIETPLSAYWKLAHDETYSFLLESVTGGEQLARYSVLGVRPRSVIRCKGNQQRILRDGRVVTSTFAPGTDPLHALQSQLGKAPIPVAGLPAFVGGAVGMLSYDLVRFFENLPDGTMDDLNVDDLAMQLVDAVVVFDHAKQIIKVIVVADGSAEDYDRAITEIDRIEGRLSGPLPPLPEKQIKDIKVSSNVTQVAFERNVTRVKEYITAGDGLQMVPSQRFSTPLIAHPVSVYRELRSINPSPYMFLIRFGEFDLVGASPELHASLHGRTARVRPIAGTRWRGQTPKEDAALAKELLADEKERAEHIMLVDLGRNDLGRVCKFGSVEVNDLMVIEKYSHVMHIVSDVTGQLTDDQDAYDLIRATFPAGTVSGAPKVRAMQIIDELETTRRGSYGGAVGFFSQSGDMDTCIALRTIYIQDGMAYVQAGGGVVFDSDPTYEFNESCNKARACLRAIEAAQR